MLSGSGFKCSGQKLKKTNFFPDCLKVEIKDILELEYHFLSNKIIVSLYNYFGVQCS